MALFPAYSNKYKSAIEPDEKQHLQWLHNESCPDIPLQKVSQSLSDSSDDTNECTKKDELKFMSSPNEGSDSSTSVKPKKIKKKKKKHKKYHTENKSLKKSKNKSRKKKRKHSDDDFDSDDSNRSSKRVKKDSSSFATLDGRQKGILFEGDFRCLSKDEAIYFDKYPDKNNSVFCTTHYSQLCSYNKIQFFPLGMDRPSRKKNASAQRYFSVRSRIPLQSVPVKALVKQDVKNFDYIPLNITYSEQQSSNQEKTQDSDIGNSDAEFYSEKHYWQNQNKKLNENLSKEPSDISLWLQFIEIQDKVMAYCFDENNEKRSKVFNKDQKALIERKLSVLDSAISKNPKALELHLKKLDLGEIIWDIKAVESEWNKLISKFPNKKEVWHSYLAFYQSNFSAFHLDHIAKAYSKCTEKLSLMYREIFVSHRPPENLVFELVDIIVQLAYVWRQGGFMERSVALFQSLFELNFYCPKRLNETNIDLDSKLDLFEAFWDSKAPRFGEKSAVGWAQFMEKSEPVTFPEKILEGTHDEEDDILLKGGEKHDLWLEMEFSREHNHWLPFQEDPDECEDTDRMVSFNVVRPYLFVLKEEEEKFYLALKFLNFFGVSTPSGTTIGDPLPWREFDHAFSHSRLETLECLIDSNDEFVNKFGLFNFPVIGPSIFKVESEFYFEFICNLLYRFMTLFSSLYRIRFAVIFINVHSRRGLAVKAKHKDNILWKQNIKNYKKRIKNLLKDYEFRSNPNLYFEFAKFEACHSSKDDACKIHIMIMKLLIENTQGNGEIFEENEHCFNIWQHLVSYVRLQLEKDGFDENTGNCIFNLVCGAVFDSKFVYSDHPPNALQILRLRNRLETYIDSTLSLLIVNDSHFKYFILKYCISLHTMILLMLESVEYVYGTFEKYLSKLSPEIYSEEDFFHMKSLKDLKYVTESLFEDYLWTISLAKNKSHFKGNRFLSHSAVKCISKLAIKVSPHNFVFLETLAKTQVWRDLIFGSNIQAKKSNILVVIFRIVPHIKKVVSIISSAQFGDISAGHRLKSLLESAVTSDIGKNCPLLWRIYLRLMSVMKKDKDVLNVAYRALHNCPFAKCLYLDCISLLPEKMNEILKMMNEKGIRIRLPVEELELLLEEEKEDFEDADEEKLLTTEEQVT